MKVNIEFNLPEEKYELLQSLKGLEALIVIDKLFQYIRSEIKHNDPIIQTNHETLEKLRNELYLLLEDYDINIDGLLS